MNLRVCVKKILSASLFTEDVFLQCCVCAIYRIWNYDPNIHGWFHQTITHSPTRFGRNAFTLSFALLPRHIWGIKGIVFKCRTQPPLHRYYWRSRFLQLFLTTIIVPQCVNIMLWIFLTSPLSDTFLTFVTFLEAIYLSKSGKWVNVNSILLEPDSPWWMPSVMSRKLLTQSKGASTKYFKGCSHLFTAAS